MDDPCNLMKPIWCNISLFTGRDYGSNSLENGNRTEFPSIFSLAGYIQVGARVDNILSI